MNRSRAPAMLLLVAVILLAALMSVLAKRALADVPSFTFVWLLIAIGGAWLSVYTFLFIGEPFPRRLPRRTWTYIAVIGICNFTIVRLLFMAALERLPATTHAYLVNFVGIVTMLMSVFVMRESPSLLQVLGVLIALAGIRVFFREIPPSAEMTGVLYVAIAVVALAAYNNVARKLVTTRGNDVSNTVIATVAVWIGGLPIVLAGCLTDLPPRVTGWQNWAIIAANGVVSIGIVLPVFNHVLRTLRWYEASLLASTGVVFTALLAVPILGEQIDAYEIVGIGMMLAGITLVQFRRSLSRPRAPTPDDAG